MKFHVFGAGLSGLTIARLLIDRGHEVEVHEKSPYVGGALRTERNGDTEIHKFGAHIFHTNDEDVIKFINRFEKWKEYKHQVQALIKRGVEECIVQLPLSTRTLKDFYGTEDMDLINFTIGSVSGMKYPNEGVQNMINRIGWDLFTYVIKNYSELQWGCNIENVPGGAIDRIGFKPYDVMYYFTDKYQLLPQNGYDIFLGNLLAGIEIHTDDETTPRDYTETCIYTGSIDELMYYNKGQLRYRTLEWENCKEDQNPYELPVINTPTDKYFTRTIYHHNFNHTGTKVITREHPMEWTKDLENTHQRYYPINDDNNLRVYQKYLSDMKSEFGDRIILAGRLGTYKYLDMDDTIIQAMEIVKEICHG